ncbi:MAG: DoxX family protein [Haloarculaceae archaeon]
MERGPLLSALVSAVSLAAVATPVAAHVDYVTDTPSEALAAVQFLSEVLSRPLNAALLGGTLVAVLVLVAGYLRFRPVARDIEVLRETLAGYEDLVPWMLRLSLGLPLVGAGFAGYLFAPTVGTDLRLVQISLGFLILFGLATRAVAAVGLLVYLWALAVRPGVILAIEYLPGFVALVLLGSGRPSADHILQRVAEREGTLYGRIDPVHDAAARFNDRIEPFARYVPTVLRVGLGVGFVFLGVTQKLAQPASALAVVEKYNLTAVVPVDPGLWVVGAGLTEAAVGLALIVGLFTRANAGVAFLLFTLTLFGLPDDPVLAHVTLFGMTSAVFTLGAGPLALDTRLAERPTTDRSPAPAD